MFRELTEAGIDTNHALELLLAIRRIGARELEQRFGPGQTDEDQINGRRAVLVAENMQHLQQMGRDTIEALGPELTEHLRSRELRACMATTDVHEYGKIVVEQVFKELHVAVTDAGTSADPDVVARSAARSGADFIALSTYNGIALTYLKTLRQEIDRLGLDIPIFVGGRINQIPDGPNTSLPVDVSDKVGPLGVSVCAEVGEMLTLLAREPADVVEQ